MTPDSNPTFGSEDASVYISSSLTSWQLEYLEDVSLDVKSGLVVFNNLAAPHAVTIRLFNREHRYTDELSNSYIDKGRKILVEYNNKRYKCTVTDEPTNIEEEYIELSCSSISYDTSQKFVCFRPPLSVDGQYTLEDTVWAAFYEIGYHNFLDIYMEDGTKYVPGRSMPNPIVVDMTNPFYNNVSPLSILNELCAYAGYAWYEDPTDDYTKSRIVLIDLKDEYDSDVDGNLISLYKSTDIKSISMSVDYASIINEIRFDNSHWSIIDHESVKRYGLVRSKKLSMPDNPDVKSILKHGHKFLQVAKDPDISSTIVLNGIMLVDDLNTFVKVLDDDGKSIQEFKNNSALRLKTLTHDLSKMETSFVVGTIERAFLLDDLEDRLKGGMALEWEDAQYIINKTQGAALQIHADKDMIDSSPTDITNTMPAILIGIDYINDPWEYDSESYIYMNDDGLRQGV